MKLGIGWILSGGSRDFVAAPFFRSVCGLIRAVYKCELGPYQDIVWMESREFPIDAARNELCQMALETGCDRVLFLDTDHEFTTEAVARLLAHDVDVVTGRYHVKKPPYHPNLYVIPKQPHLEGEYKTVHYGRGLFKIDRCGAGALLLSRRVLEAVGDPWFAYQRNPNPPHRMTVSEDFYFCQRAQEEGFELWADWDAEFGHIVQGIVDGHWRDEALRSLEAEIRDGRSDLIDHLVVRGYPDGYTLPGGQVVRDYASHSVG